MEMNNKILEAALKIVTTPGIYGPDAPLLQTLELFEKVKKIYQLGFEDGRKQKEADEIIKLAESGRD